MLELTVFSLGLAAGAETYLRLVERRSTESTGAASERAVDETPDVSSTNRA